jgi:hypothetical protein
MKRWTLEFKGNARHNIVCVAYAPAALLEISREDIAIAYQRPRLPGSILTSALEKQGGVGIEVDGF